jgi:two-component system chemotaxis response regulator CheB
MTDMDKAYDAMVIGASVGGMEALNKLLSLIPRKLKVPTFIVLHIHKDSDCKFLAEHLQKNCCMQVKEASEYEQINSGCIYIAPPNYHLMVESNKVLSLSVDPKVNFSRPSVDVLFESASDAYLSKLIGVVLTGANNDGAQGMLHIWKNGGKCVVQNTQEAYCSEMPMAVLKKVPEAQELTLDEIAKFLSEAGI